MKRTLSTQQRAILEKIHNGLIVSCQAREGEPLFGAENMARLAQAAHLGGAVGIRANSPPDIHAIKQHVALTLIGIFKKEYPDSTVYITPTLEEAQAVCEAGADIVAIDATGRQRPRGERLEDIVHFLQHHSSCLLMADISTFEEGVEAERMGFDIVGTTLAGYTEYSKVSGKGPALELVGELVQRIERPVIAEGRITTPKEAAEALKRGAWAVVVGTAITRPHELTRRFVEALGKKE